MFNDPLTKEQCERLTTQLSFTAFPFQCAHGRYVHFLRIDGSTSVVQPRQLWCLRTHARLLSPSMVPLTSFGDMSRRPRVKTLVDWETFRVGVRDEH